MTPAEKLALEAGMQVLAAEDELRAGVADDDRMYDLVLLVTGSRERAGEELARRQMWRQRQKSAAAE